ncbi:MAG TPA: sugar ABC transporter substrate-binding protein [Solirubrobacteraceae bacterium]|nr:sugar ABC transporter substrate-binding protein [Solirubrobacteraceae bacterium]
MRIRRATHLAAGALALVAATALAACGGDDGGTSSSGAGGKTIALLLPETKTTRYEEHDRPAFEAKVKQLCPDCRVIYANATQDASKQQTQAEAALTDGANVLVLDAVDVGSVAPIVQQAKQRDVPVIAYDRLISDQPIDYYVSFNNVRQGELQGQSLIDGLGGSGQGKSIVMINGAPTDPSAGDYKKGAHNVLDASGVKIAKEYDTPDWSPDKAQREMEQATTALGKDGFDGVYSANDGMAGGAIAALKGGGIDPTTRPITGGDGEVAAIQRILVGEQYSTIYLTIDKQAETAARLAVAAAQGKPAPQGLVNARVDNGAGRIASVLLTPVVVTKDNIKDTVIKDGFLKPSDICTGRFAAACRSAGIS